MAPDQARPPSGRALLALALLLLAATAVRAWLVSLPGHSGDVQVVAGWAERMAEVGPLRFYQGMLVVYPALLYLYAPLGMLLDGSALDLAIKGSSIPFDLAIGIVLFLVVRRTAGEVLGVGAAALYLLNPAVLVAGPMWGQVDAAGTLLFLLALVAAAKGRWATSGALAVLAGLTKPQFGLVALPVGWCAIAAWRVGGEASPLRRAVVGALAAYAVVAGPLLLDPVRYADQLSEIAGYKPYASVSAPNPWGLLVGMQVPDGGLFWVGAALLALGLAASLLPLRRRRDLATLLAVGTLIVFAFYCLPTRVHERYLFPAMALLVPFAATSARSLLAYAALALAFTASLLASLGESNPAAVPIGLREVLVTSTTTCVIGITLLVAASASAWLMLRAPASASFARDVRDVADPLDPRQDLGELLK
jgi:dolichyl-phosphate-mannose-protein mannosyltransferase